jgi:PAS domain S-box-containing protein
VFAGALFSGLFVANQPLVEAVLYSAGATLEALLGVWLFHRSGWFDADTDLTSQCVVEKWQLAMRFRLPLSILLPFVACAVQWLLWGTLKPFVWLLFFPAAFFSTWIGGLRGGLAGTSISALLAWYLFLPPQFSFALENPAYAFSIAVFVTMGGLFAFVFDRLQRAARRTEEALAASHTANEKINLLYQKTLELDTLKNQFFANVSHELRTPLTLILAPLEKRLTSADLTVMERRETEIMLRNARLLYRHVSDLLDVAKIEAGHKSMNWSKTDLAGLARTTASNFELVADEHRIAYTVSSPDKMPVDADSEKLQRVLINLLSNAFKFTPDGGAITLRLSEREGRALIEIQDNGPGVPSAQREAVFDRFIQIEEDSRRMHGGTGLGLSIVKSFVEMHGGEVTLGEAPGGGALFAVRLPLAAAFGTTLGAARPIDKVLSQQAIDELKVPAPAAVMDESQSVGLPLILVVEDNADMNEFICATLRPHYQVASAKDGREGLNRVLEMHPDLVIADLMMPVMGGYEMVLALRGHPDLADMPIVMLTAKADEKLRVRLLLAGVQDYLNKPFSADELLARVDGLVAARQRYVGELRRSEEAQRMAKVGSWNWDVKADKHIWSKEIYRIYGRDLALPPAVYPEVQQYFTPESWAMLAADVEKGIAQGIPYECDAEVVRPDGDHCWITARGEAMRDADGNVINLHGTVQDINERKRAEEQLKLWASYFENANFGLAIADVKTNTFLAVNPTFARERGYRRDELIGQSVMKVFPADIADQVKARISALEVATHGVFESEHQCKDGRRFPVMLDITVTYSADGKPFNRIAYALNLSERKQAEAAVHKAESWFRAVVESSDDAIIGKDLNGIITSWNPGAEMMFGYSIKEAVGQQISMLFLPGTEDEEQFLLDQIRRGKQVSHYEARRIRKDGREIYVSISLSPIRDDAGHIVGASKIARDITERKNTEREIRLINADLERRVAERTAELTAANIELDSFAYAVSHDLRAPLRAMSGFSHALDEDYGKLLNGEAHNYLDQINLASIKMSELIDGLLSLSRSTRGELSQEAIDITAMSERLLGELAKNEPERKVATQVAAGLQAHGDARMIEAVMRNLLDNAWKYSPHAAVPVIRVYTEEHEGVHRFCVADNGAGFEMARYDRLFRPFQRLHRQEEFPGIGIGLATVQRILHRHGGSIEARGEPGKGAVFCFTLPSLPAESAPTELVQIEPSVPVKEKK